MSELLWQCKDGLVLSSAKNGLELSVSRAGPDDGFRYQLMHPNKTTAGKVSVASGYRLQLVDAISAAERIAKGWDTFAPSNEQTLTPATNEDRSDRTRQPA